MRDLLRSHEQDIVERVVLRLSFQQLPHFPSQPQNPYAPNQPVVDTLRPVNRTLTRIKELERQLAELRRGQDGEQATAPARTRALGESASGMAEAVELLFPGVERSPLTQIIENRFKPTNICRLLATGEDRSESQRTISIGGVEFEQAERDGKEAEYRMTSLFKAWAAYTGILIKLAPHSLQGELATALAIYTMNLYELFEKYSWEGVRSYHFQFHRKRVAGGKNIYQPIEWRLLDSELVASKCFAHPIPQLSWNPGYKSVPAATRRTYDITNHENFTWAVFTYPPMAAASTYSTSEQQSNQNPIGLASSNTPLVLAGAAQLNGQACRNWNYRELYSPQHLDTSKSQTAPQPTLPGQASSQKPARPNTSLCYLLFTPHTCPMPAGQLKYEGWKELTSDYPDKPVISAILGICRFGARIGYEGCRTSAKIYPNLPTADVDSQLVTADIQAELRKGRLEQYAEENTLPKYFTASPLGLTDKADGTKRRIYHLSYPSTEPISINGAIPEHYGRITYSTIDQAIYAIQKHGENCQLVKGDFESAFRHIPVAPHDTPLLGFHWEK
ncbi:hypothetical protein HOY80DRAFT_1114733 [Tuber brumale]|nr:hypothetical protein HOY80DRAFT_1114733 [Tuber brumale]